MKTAIQELIDIVEMESENFVEISMKVFHKMLLDAKGKECEQITDAFNQGYREGEIDWDLPGAKIDVSKCSDASNYYQRTFNKYEDVTD